MDKSLNSQSEGALELIKLMYSVTSFKIHFSVEKFNFPFSDLRMINKWLGYMKLHAEWLNFSISFKPSCPQGANIYYILSFPLYPWVCVLCTPMNFIIVKICIIFPLSFLLLKFSLPGPCLLDLSLVSGHTNVP